MRSFFVLLLCAFAWAFEARVALPILEVNDQTLITPAMDLRRGESGFVVHELDSLHSMIIARAVVVGVQNNRATLALQPYRVFDNASMPLPLNTPQVGDQAIFRAFSNRAFAIAPNQQVYQAVVARYPNIEWFHPDLFAAFLANQGRAAPTMEHFREICDAYAVGVVYLVRKNLGELRDCQTFAVLKQDLLDVEPSEPMKPFFSRLGNMERSWIGFLRRDPKMTDYFQYYDNLIREQARKDRMGIAHIIDNRTAE